MSKPGPFQLNRREFVATSGAVGAVILLPITLPAARTATGAAIASATPEFQPHVYCEFESDGGILRPSGWQHSNGARLDVERAEDGCVAGFRLGNTVCADEYFLPEEFHFGRAQEIIRHKFGENVLSQVIEAIDAHPG